MADPSHSLASTLQIAKPHFSEAQQRAIADGIAQILKSGRLINGPFAAELERTFATRTGTKHAIAVNTCTSALQICLSYLGAAGAEVLVPAAAFTTDVSVVRWGGAKPVLVDIDPQTLSFDPTDLERKITPRTKGMIWVHLTGLMASNYRALLALAEKHGLFVLEDCGHAQGARADGRAAGSIGVAGCFSFFPTKVMTCGVGGMITTNDPALDRHAREMRFFGRGTGGGGEVAREGNDWLLDEFRACIALAQLREIDDALSRRRRIAAIYQQALSNQPGIRLFDIPNNIEHAYYQYPLLLDDRLSVREMSQALKDKHGVEAKKIYLPVHQEKIFREYDTGGLKAAERTLLQSICLPMHAGLSEQDAERAAAALIAEVRARL